MLRLYQAEWCPFSSAVRELLTELGLPFVAVPVEPWPEQRTDLRRRFGTDEIPVLETDDGAVHRGTREIIAYLTSLPQATHAREHRERYAEHREARVEDAAAQVLRHAEPADLEVRDNPEQSRYELLRGGGVIGHATYRLDGPRLVVPYVEVDPAYEGRGLGSQLCAGLLEDARARGLSVDPQCPFLARYMERLAERQQRALVLEQEALEVQPAPEAGERPVRADDAVAREDHRDRVLPVRRADRASRVRAETEPARLLAIAHGLAVRNRRQREPALLLELRAARSNGRSNSVSSPLKYAPSCTAASSSTGELSSAKSFAAPAHARQPDARMRSDRDVPIGVSTARLFIARGYNEARRASVRRARR